MVANRAGVKISINDQVCSQIIQAAFHDSVMTTGLLNPADVIDFADSFVFDERVETCYAYDPRDAL